MTMLEVHDINVYYGDIQAVAEVSFTVGTGEIVTLIGANGAGKTTVLKTVSGLLSPRRGQIRLEGRGISGRPPYELVERGLVLIPEARQLWPGMTVRENLEMGAYCKAARARRTSTLEAVFAMFPQLKPRASQKAGTLSGGEQQMCAIGRGLMAGPELLMFDSRPSGSRRCSCAKSSPPEGNPRAGSHDPAGGTERSPCARAGGSGLRPGTGWDPSRRLIMKSQNEKGCGPGSRNPLKSWSG